MGNVIQHHQFRFDEFVVDVEAWSLYRNGTEIHLEPTVLRLLVYLVEHRDRLVTRDELMDTVWTGTVISDAALSKAVARLRKALGDHADHPRFVETVHSLGYRFLPEVEVEQPEEGSRPASAGGSRVGRRGIIVVILAAAAIVVLLLLSGKETAPGAHDDGPIRSMAVLPLKNMTGDPDRQALVDGLHELLTMELSRLGGLRVPSSQSTIRFRDSERPLPDIARDLQVEAIALGSVLSVDDVLHLTVQLVDGRSDFYLWSNSYEGDARDLLAVIAAAAADLAAQAQPVAFEPPEAASAEASLDPEAGRAFLEGLVHLNTVYQTGSLRRAIELFERAVALEPGFTLAWGNLAVAYGLLAMAGGAPPQLAVPRARDAALKALETDSQHYIGHSTLGWVRLWTWDWQGAAEAFEHALELNPSDYYALHGKADSLMLAGELEQSLEPIRESQVLDPFTPMSSMPLPTHLYMMHRYDQAIAEAKAISERIPAYSTHWLLARIYWQQQLFEESLREERLELELNEDEALLVALEQGGGDKAPRDALRAMAAVLIERSRNRYVDPFDIAVLFARVGDDTEALDWLTRAADNGSPKLTYVEFWPDFDALHGDPRFTSLLQRMGLPGR